MAPEETSLDDAAVLRLRGPKAPVDARRAYGAFRETEVAANGALEDCGVVLITNRECPFRCIYCDLWTRTTDRTSDAGVVAAQIAAAIEAIGPVPHLKLYNAGSFFDERAIPAADRAVIARRVAAHRTVIVESHPAFLGEAAPRFAASIGGELEVAVGLETIDPAVLGRLNKKMSLDEARTAFRFLASNGIAARAFVMLRLPWQSEEEGVLWATRSIEWAFDQGARVVVVIPTRGGNGLMEKLREEGAFAPPRLESLVETVQRGLAMRRGRVFADLWGAAELATGEAAAAGRMRELEILNRTQRADASGGSS